AIQFVNAIAIGTAGAALVGQNIGAGRPDRAGQVVRTGLGWIVWISIAMSAVFMLFPDAFLSLFTRDAGVHGVGVPYLRVLALCLPFTGVEIVTTEAIVGSGHTAMLSWIFIAFSALRIPLAFLVPQWTHSGVIGIAWLITATCVLRASLIVAWAARGTWKRGLGAELHGAEGS
ncbi:MAG TPA: MATE family efflux transporter, partial [Dongiaceae bacterium]|nr:MATE family efflux transporter [Dongiaceae bacterium]